MFIQLTRTNGSPLWLNPEFLLRIEPWKNGSLVVPAGDDLDYEVRESPQAVMALIGGVASAPKPVPPPPPPPVPGPETPAAVEPTVEAPKKRTRRTASKKKDAEPKEAPAAEAAAPVADEPSEPASSAIRVSPAPAEDDLVVETAARLKKHGCKSETRILNSLKSMFRRKSDAEIVSLLQQMEDRGLVTLDDNGHAAFA